MSDIASVAGVPGALQSATGAINRNLRALDKDAAVIAKSPAVESRETVHALVDSRQQLLYTQAAAKIIRATDEMTQSLIDIRA
jgi:pyruvate/oxaloacetate carboxyltransferase